MNIGKPMTESQIAHIETWAKSPLLLLLDLLATIRDREARLRRAVEACLNYAHGRKDPRECEWEMKDVIAENADLMGESPC